MKTRDKISASVLYQLFLRPFTPEGTLSAAAGLLEQTDLSVTEVCYSVGYNLPAAFTKAFRSRWM